jgi:hypothetical protein
MLITYVLQLRNIHTDFSSIQKVTCAMVHLDKLQNRKADKGSSRERMTVAKEPTGVYHAMEQVFVDDISRMRERSGLEPNWFWVPFPSPLPALIWTPKQPQHLDLADNASMLNHPIQLIDMPIQDVCQL